MNVLGTVEGAGRSRRRLITALFLGMVLGGAALMFALGLLHYGARSYGLLSPYAVAFALAVLLVLELTGGIRRLAMNRRVPAGWVRDGGARAGLIWGTALGSAPRDSRPAADLRVGCGESVQGELTADRRRYTYTFGPLSIFGVRSGTAGQASTGRISKPSFHKALVVVNPGSSATIVIPDEQRGRVSLFYDPRRSPTNITSVSDGMSTVTFQACADRQTQFAGGFIVESGVSDFRITISAGSQTRTVPLTF